jgi:hypothetical protein
MFLYQKPYFARPVWAESRTGRQEMKVRQFPIEDRVKPGFADVAGPGDFVLGQGFDIDAQVLIENHRLSLYCLDDEGRTAVFVELPPDLDLTRAPFIYSAQYDNAQSVVTVPYETFISLAGELPAVQQPIMVYMSGAAVRPCSAIFSTNPARPSAFPNPMSLPSLPIFTADRAAAARWNCTAWPKAPRVFFSSPTPTSSLRPTPSSFAVKACG